jgi:hypothetical protein
MKFFNDSLICFDGEKQINSGKGGRITDFLMPAPPRLESFYVKDFTQNPDD